jgi:thiopurine S-methyltransferase
MIKKIFILFSFLAFNLNNIVSAKETNITNEYWLSLWKTNKIGWHLHQPNPLFLEYIKYFKLKPGSKIFVPLSGKSIDMLWLAKQGYQVIGVELNLQACQLFFTENKIPYKQTKDEKFDILTGENITLMSGDFFNLDKSILGQVDAVYDRAALIALPIETRRRYVKKMLSLIEPHTQILLITFIYNESEIQGPPFSVDENEVKKYFGKKYNILQLYKEPVVNIPEHLQAIGLTRLQELVFKLERHPTKHS